MSDQIVLLFFILIAFAIAIGFVLCVLSVAKHSPAVHAAILIDEHYARNHPGYVASQPADDETVCAPRVRIEPHF